MKAVDFRKRVIKMLDKYPVSPTIPITDIQRAKDFYQNILDLKLESESDNDLLFGAGGGTKLYLYKRGPSKADHTLCGFTVDNLEEVVKELAAKGIKFEQYDIPGFIKTDEMGIATMDTEKAAWLKDPDGNILGISQRK